MLTLDLPTSTLDIHPLEGLSSRTIRKVSLLYAPRKDGRTDGASPYAPGTPSLLRALNERTILELLRREGPVSRAEMARTSGLSKPTVSQALAGLEAAGLVRTAGRTEGRKGPGAALYELNPRSGLVVGLDVGRNWVRGALADITGGILARRQERTARSGKLLVEQIGSLAHGLADDVAVDWGDVTRAAVGHPGVLDASRGRLSLAPNLPGRGRRDLVEEVRGRLGEDVTFENDVNLAALGELTHGAARGVANFVFLWVGTGVGLGIVIDGQVYRGSAGAAGEIGYMPIGLTDPHDRANRRRGALEEAASAAGIVRTARELGLERPLSPKSIFAAARAGDELAGRVVAAEAGRIALAIAAVTPVLDPELVVLGGGIAGGGGDLLVDLAGRELAQLSPFRPRIDVSELGEDAVLQGAVSIALATAQDRVFNRNRDQERREIVV